MPLTSWAAAAVTVGIGDADAEIVCRLRICQLTSAED